MSSDFIKKMSSGLILNILLRLKSLIYFPIIVNILSKQDVGNLAFAIAVSSLLIGFALLNIPDSSNRYFKLQEGYRTEKVDIHTYNITISYSLAALAVFTLVYYLFAPSLIEDGNSVKIIYTLLIAKAFNKLTIFIYQIEQNVKQVLYFQSAIEYLSLISVVLIYFGKYDVDYRTIVTLNVIIEVAISVIFITKVRFIKHFRPVIDIRRGKKIVKTSLYLMPTIYAMTVMQNADFLIIKKLLGVVDLSEYSFSYSLASIVLGLQMALSIFWFSKATRIEKNEREQLFNYLPAISATLCFAIYVFYEIAIEFIINLINAEYANSSDSATILATSFVLYAAASMYAGILYADKKENKILFSMIFAVSLNIALNIWLIPSYGIIGAAYSTGVSYFVLLLTNIILARKIVKIQNSTIVTYLLTIIPLVMAGK